MPYESIQAAKDAGFPTSAEGVDLTLSQINRLAEIYDAIKKAGTADNPMAAAWTQWKKLYKKQVDKWVELSGNLRAPDGMEASVLAYGQSSLNYTTDQKTGDIVFHDVILLAEGAWTDGHSRKEIHYSGADLAKMKFEKRTFKANHDIFGQLPITNDVGVIENEKFVQHPTPRWVSDVRIFPTQNGNDVATLLKRGAITDISSELFSIHLKKNGNINATDIIFMGAASVRTGACTVCTFNEGESNMTDPTDTEPTGNGGVDPVTEAAQTPPDIAALEAQLALAKTERAAHDNHASAELEAANKKIAELEQTNTELSARIAADEHDGRVAELQRQIEALSITPVIHTRVSTTPTNSTPVELDSDEFRAYSAMDMEG